MSALANHSYKGERGIGLAKREGKTEITHYLDKRKEGGPGATKREGGRSISTAEKRGTKERKNLKEGEV